MKILKIIGIVILLLALVVIGLYFFLMYKSNNLKNTKDLEARIDKLVAEKIKQKQLKGIVIGIVTPDKVFIKGFGLVSDNSTDVPDSSTIFELASIGKLFTTSVLQMGVSRGDFDLNDKISKHLASKVAVSNACTATLLNLATHTSGFPSLPKNMLDKMQDEQNPYKNLQISDLYDYLKTCNENKAIGDCEYSNFGMGVLGHILELKYNKKYEDIVKTEICNPLKMTNTTINLSPEQGKKLAQGYDQQGLPNPVWQDPVLQGAGSFLSNAEDMVKFIKANLDENYSPISPNLMACHTPQLNGETGLGWHLANTFVDNLVGIKGLVWHNGGAGGYSSYLAIDKKTKSGLIILSNSANDVTELGQRIMQGVKNISFEK